MPFGITREVEYSVTNGGKEVDVDDHESRSEVYGTNRTPSLPNLDER